MFLPLSMLFWSDLYKNIEICRYTGIQDKKFCKIEKKSGNALKRNHEIDPDIRQQTNRKMYRVKTEDSFH